MLGTSHSASCLWDCMQVVEFPDVEGALEFQYDEEWLGVLQATHHLMSLNRQQAPLPGTVLSSSCFRLATTQTVQCIAYSTT